MNEVVKKLKAQAIDLDFNILQAVHKSTDKKQQEALEEAADILEHQVIEWLRTAEQTHE